MLFLLALKDWQIDKCFLWRKDHVVSIGIGGLTSVCFNKRNVVTFGIDWLTSSCFHTTHVVSIGIEGLTSVCVNKRNVVSFGIDWLTRSFHTTHVVSIGIEGLARSLSCFNKTTCCFDWHWRIDRLTSVFFWRKNMLFLLALKDWQVFVLTKKCCYFWHWLTYK